MKGLSSLYIKFDQDFESLENITTGECLSHNEIHVEAEKMQAKLRSIGIGKGLRVAMAFQNDRDWIVSFLALTSLGSIVVPFSPTSKMIEISNALESYAVDAIFSDYEFLINNSDYFDSTASIQYIVTPQTQTGDLPPGLLSIFYDLSLIESSRHPLSIPADEQVVTCHFTYKGLGYPLAVEHAFGDFCDAVESCQKVFQFSERQKILSLIPSFPVFGLVTNLLFPLSYKSLVFVSQTTPRSLLKVIDKYKINHVNIVPPLIDLMISEGQRSGGRDLSHLCFVSGGSYLSLDKIKHFETLFRTRPVQGYGLTETLPIFTNRPEENAAGSLGKIMRPGVSCQISDAKGEPVPTGKVGEICFKGKGVCQSYANMSAPSPQIFRQGWLRTGDLGHFDQEGNLYFIGRRLPFCKILGHMVDLRQVENLALQVKGVTRARCYTVRETGRKKLCLSVSVKREFEKTQKEMVQYFKERLSAYRCPSIVKIYTVSYHEVTLERDKHE